MTDISCKLPWIVNFVRIYDDRWKFCCKVNYNNYSTNVALVEEVKEHFLDGKKHPVCSSCWVEESKGGVSFRTAEPVAIANINDIRKNPPLSIIDLEFGDVCNMHCLTCGPENSTKWQNILKIYPHNENKFDSAWEKLSRVILNNPISHINMHGGEPSMDPNFTKIIDNLIAIGFKKRIRIITNGNYSGQLGDKFSTSIDKLVSNGNTIEVIFSLDTAGSAVEWLRGGLSIDKWKSNILAMSEKNVQLAINISISILNLENHIDVLWLLDELRLLDSVELNINTVNTPHHFSVSNLGSATKDFLPKKWPTNMSLAWLKYNDKFCKFIQPQINITNPPGKLMLVKLLSVINDYSANTKIAIDPYYREYISRLSDIISK